MHDLADYFEDLETVFQSPLKYSKGYLGARIINCNYKDSKVVLIGLSETRNAIDSASNCDPNAIREKLYSLSSAAFDIRVSDLGNLKSGNTVSDTYSAIEYITNHLIGDGKIPIFFGGSHDLSLSMGKAIQTFVEPNIVIIDSKADIEDTDETHSQSFIQHFHKINNRPYRINLLAFQSYFVTTQQLHLLENNSIEQLRLGLVRNNIAETEPYFRDAHMVSIDMTATRFPDFQASKWLSPNGLYGEEICQLANYAGMSDNASIYHIAEFNTELDSRQQSAHLISQVLWHLLSGINYRKGDYPVKSLKDYKKIYVNIDKTESSIVFYQNEQNNRFWLEIPKGGLGVTIMSCSEQDYRLVCNNSIPDRISRKIGQYLK